MSPALSVVAGADVIAPLTGVGFVQLSQRDSRLELRREGRAVIVPMQGELAPGTLRSVLRQAGPTTAGLVSPR